MTNFCEFHLQKVAKLAIIFVYFRDQIVTLTSRESRNGYILKTGSTWHGYTKWVSVVVAVATSN